MWQTPRSKTQSASQIAREAKPLTRHQRSTESEKVANRVWAATTEVDGDGDGPLVLECTTHAGQVEPKSITTGAKHQARAWEATPISTESMSSDGAPAG